jgi:hypothetical protein
MFVPFNSQKTFVYSRDFSQPLKKLVSQCVAWIPKTQEIYVWFLNHSSTFKLTLQNFELTHFSTFFLHLFKVSWPFFFKFFLKWCKILFFSMYYAFFFKPFIYNIESTPKGLKLVQILMIILLSKKISKIVKWKKNFEH